MYSCSGQGIQNRCTQWYPVYRTKCHILQTFKGREESKDHKIIVDHDEQVLALQQRTTAAKA